MNWAINEKDIDYSQRRIYNLSTNQSCIAKTCCSEYLYLVFWRIKLIQELDKLSSILVIYHSNLIHHLFENATIYLGLNGDYIALLHQDAFYSLNTLQKYDYVFVLEMEEFTEIEIHKSMNFYRNSILFFGSDYQGVSSFESNIEHRASLLKLPIFEILNSYRLPISVAYFIKALDANYDIIERCRNTIAIKPLIIKFNSWEEELYWIKSKIDNYLISDAIILLPHFISFGKLNSVKNVASFFRENKITVLNSLFSIDYYSTLPKLMTFAQSKFCVSDYIFIPFANDLKNTKEFRVALSQASSSVILTYSGELPDFIKQIPTEYYEHN